MYADLPLLGREDRVLRELYLYWYILKNTFERVISGFIHTQEYRDRVVSGLIQTYSESTIGVRHWLQEHKV